MNINIINGNSGNISSLGRFLSHLNLDYNLVPPDFNAEEVKNNIIIIPGNGNWESIIDMLAPRREFIIESVKNHVYIIGICAGFQCLFSSSEEGPSLGLNIFDEKVEKIESQRLPVVGNILCNNSKEYYFLNSFGIKNNHEKFESIVYNINSLDYLAYLMTSNFAGFQFHPEISGSNGCELFIKTLNEFKKKIKLDN